MLIEAARQEIVKGSINKITEMGILDSTKVVMATETK